MPTGNNALSLPQKTSEQWSESEKPNDRKRKANALNHAGANLLHLTITNANGQISAVYTNNGTQPKQEIIEGGGLTSLRERIERSGGIMTVQSLPFYSLTLTLPEYTKGGNSL